MPKNQFQRPAPIKHGHSVPRHGKPLPQQAKVAAKPRGKAPEAGLPPLTTLLESAGRK
jgi:hypothetical protein